MRTFPALGPEARGLNNFGMQSANTLKHLRYRSIDLIDLTTQWVPMNMVKSMQKLLQAIPHEQLEGLESITIKDKFSNPILDKTGGIYFKAGKTTSARIELSAKGVFVTNPRVACSIPIGRKVLLAATLYRELARHRLEQVEGLSKKERNEFVNNYSRQCMRAAFKNLYQFIQWCGPLKRWIKKRNKSG